MYDISVPAIYVATDRIRTEKEHERLERFLGSVDYDRLIEGPHDELLASRVSDYQNTRTARTGQRTGVSRGYPSLFFTTFNWDDPLNSPERAADYVPFEPGRFRFADFRDKVQLREQKGVACNSGYEIHTAFGCLHACTYCHIGNTFTIMLDVETFIDNLDRLMERSPQKLYKYDNQSDILTLEPEYGATKALVEHFANTNKTLMLYTKSDNVDSILDLDHKGQTIVCWTLSCDEVANDHELNAPPLDKRIEAARKCQEAGYGIRFRFSPLIPIQGWEEKNIDMIDEIFKRVQPEVISLETLCHMSKAQCDELYPDLAFEPRILPTEYELFSHEDRKKMYTSMLRGIRERSSKTRLALCLETDRMWRDLQPILGGCSDDFYCCCGAECA